MDNTKNFMIPLLPHWCITDLNPAFYDTESKSAIGQTARLYAKMEKLVESYNKWIDEINVLINQYDSQTSSDLNQFKTEINQICHNYIQTMDLKIAHQDREIEESITYIKDNIYNSVKSIIEEMKDSGELNDTILSSLEGVNENINNLESLLNNEVEKIFDLQQDNNQNKQDIASMKQYVNELKEININEKIMTLEEDNITNKEKIETLEINNSNVKHSVDLLDVDNIENKEKIRILESDNVENKTNIDLLENRADTLESRTDTLENISKLAMDEFITAKTGFTILDGNLFKDRNRYFGNFTIKKDSGNFTSSNDNVCTFKKEVLNWANMGCFLGDGQWSANDVGLIYISNIDITVSDKNNPSGKYNCAKIFFDIVTKN